MVAILFLSGCESRSTADSTPAVDEVSASRDASTRDSGREPSSATSKAILSKDHEKTDAGEMLDENLLAACLPPAELEQGWVRLFNGLDMSGLFYVGTADWRFGNGEIEVEGSEPSLLFTSFQISDFELLVDFKCAEETQSGIFLRSTVDPRDVERECYELNIAPSNDPFPTGSLVKRQKAAANPVDRLESAAWRTFRIVAQGDRIQVWLDDKQTIDYSDPKRLRRGYIGLQHQSGRISFRNLKLRPLSVQKLATDANWESSWTQLDRSEGTMKVAAQDTGLNIQGGPGQLQSKQQYKDFVLQAIYQVDNVNVDSGLLLRGVPDQFNQAYECCIYHGAPNTASQKLTTGAITIPDNYPQEPKYRLARAQPANGTDPSYLTIIVDEGQFCTWINGLLVFDQADMREANPNPRLGYRNLPGVIGLQAADKSTNITFRSVSVSPIEN